MSRGAIGTVRDERLDIARGIAIMAIVLVHVFRGLHNAGLLSQAATATLDLIVGPWCLAVFAFVGGAFVPRAVQRRGVSPYLRERVVWLVFVYLTWTLLQGGIQLATSRSTNTPASLSGILAVWHPLGHLWYLPFLAVVTVVFVPMQPWVRGRAAWVLGLAAAVSVGFWGYDGGYIGTQGLPLVVFFVVGMIIGSERTKAALDRVGRTMAAIVSSLALAVCTALSVAGLAIPPTISFDIRTVASTVLGVVVAVVTSAAILLLSHAVRSAWLLALLGRRSLDIYLAHIVMASGARIILVHLGVTSAWVLVSLCFLSGVAGSLVVSNLARRMTLGWVFDGPRFLAPRRRPQPAPHSATQAVPLTA